MTLPQDAIAADLYEIIMVRGIEYPAALLALAKMHPDADQAEVVHAVRDVFERINREHSEHEAMLDHLAPFWSKPENQAMTIRVVIGHLAAQGDERCKLWLEQIRKQEH